MTAKQVQAMQKGRERAMKARARVAVQRVKDYRAWLKADSAARANGHRPPIMPEISDADYDLARSIGAIQ